MNDVEKILNNYYNRYDEDARLIKDKAHSVEFLTTIRYIDKYLKKGNRILELGAGTGRYSLHYAKKGYKVDAIELVNKNLEILKDGITPDMDITAKQGNALNFHMYKDNTFDLTLVLGPLYHLYDDKDILRAIKEAIRVTKKNGKIFLAYITNEAIFLSYGILKGNIKNLKNISDKNWNISNLKEEIFSCFKVEEFNKLIKKFNIRKLETISVDGLAPVLAEYINKFNEEEFNLYLDYHFKNCNRQDLIGFGRHNLEIVEKI